MSTAGGLSQFGPSVQTLLRALLAAAQGATVDTLCAALGVSHNAVRQHLSALIRAGLVERGEARPSGGRPQMRYLLTSSGRDLFPRNYGLIAGGILERLYSTIGKAGVQGMLVDLGREFGAAAAERVATTDIGEAAANLADQLDALGYEARAIRRDGETQIEAYNCVFHALAKAHPEVCRFDLAFMQTASGRPVQHLECIVRGGAACRFRLVKPDSES